MSLVRACVIGVIIGFTLYAMFVLVYKQVSKESVQHLRKVREFAEVRFAFLYFD